MRARRIDILLFTATVGVLGNPLAIKLPTIFVLEIRVVETELRIAPSRSWSNGSCGGRGGRCPRGRGGRSWGRITQATSTRTIIGKLNSHPFLITSLEWLFGNPFTGLITLLLESKFWVILARRRSDHRCGRGRSWSKD